MSYTTFREMAEEARRLGSARLSVAAADDRDVLQAVKMGVEAGLVTPVLVGDERKIRDIAAAIGFSLDEAEIVHQPDPQLAALEAVKVISDGGADILLKGMVNSSDFMRAVLHPDCGLRTGRILSHLAVFEVPGFDRLLFNTDGGVNINPDLNQKIEILKNAVEFMHALGWEKPRVAVITANEAINPKMESTLDAAILTKMAESGQIRGAVVDGPLALDVAISPEAAEHKGIKSPVAGRADLLLTPTIEVGNVFGKSLIYLAKAVMAGVVLGARVPVVLTSRASRPEEKLYSLAMASLAQLKTARRAMKCG
ncbi:MAG: phosphate butyryltransferase [Clostridia bacterium]|jgi:phosphate butyryltransferase|nr:phosphate butyryltransferase [Clostridia bacterium]MDN5365281.1 phosphate butyryltransferase [Thermacetogenium sp.]MDN5376426.1 phosphate butyryltransferase [Thermacetogenium sp.]